MTETLTEGRTFTHRVHPNYSGGRSISYEMTEMAYDGEVIAVRVAGRLYNLCHRCGQGYGRYMHNGMDDVCYTCQDRAFGEETTEADAIRRHVTRVKAAARREAKREAERLAKVAKRDAELAVWTAENPDVAEGLKAHLSPVSEDGYADFDFRPRDRFLTSLADAAVYSVLWAKQTEAARTALARLVEQDAEQVAEKAAAEELGHWGTVGKRAEVTVTVTDLKSFEGDYGTRWLVTMKTAEGHTLKTWTSGSFVDTAIDRENDGEAVTIKATVKEHGSYRDLPETTVTRVAVV